MGAKTVHLHERAREGILQGVNLLADAAKVTLGPRGRNVLIQRSYGAPLITKDGVTVVKEIELEGKFENMGALLIREVATKTSDIAGDGTTTATVLAQAILLRTELWESFDERVDSVIDARAHRPSNAFCKSRRTFSAAARSPAVAVGFRLSQRWSAVA